MIVACFSAGRAAAAIMEMDAPAAAATPPAATVLMRGGKVRPRTPALRAAAALHTLPLNALLHPPSFTLLCSARAPPPPPPPPPPRPRTRPRPPSPSPSAPRCVLPCLSARSACACCSTRFFRSQGSAGKLLKGKQRAALKVRDWGFSPAGFSDFSEIFSSRQRGARAHEHTHAHARTCRASPFADRARRRTR